MSNFAIARRGLLVAAGAAFAGMGFAGGVALGRSAPPVVTEPVPHGAGEAWAALMRGNARWSGGRAGHPHQDIARLHEVAGHQAPYAVVVSCIDSRVPPEVVFDAGVGDLMVVRTAAHTLDPLVKAAVEYGPQHLGVPLVVVLGHQRCGAVTAASEAIRGGARLHGDLQRVVEELRPSYRGDLTGMIQAHTRACVRRLGGVGVTVVGAYYSLDTGVVRRI